MEKVIVTGSAGFIGMHTCLSLLKKKNRILGLDNLNTYYDSNLKIKRNNKLKKFKNYTFKKIDLSDTKKVFKIFNNFKPHYVIHLAAQAGVRFSFENPFFYRKSNLDSFLNILEACVVNKVKHLTYASSSSIYGKNFKIPFSEKDEANHPTSFYAATKRSNELMAHVYSSSYNLPTTGLRFFTVYGPWGRPDMAYYIFAEAIINKTKVFLHDNGNMLRDFTYIDDAVKIIKKVYKKIPRIKKNSKTQTLNNFLDNYIVLNVGNNNPVKVKKLVEILENNFKQKLNYQNFNKHKGELKSTFASTNLLKRYTKITPNTSLDKGIKKFVKWFKRYKNINE